MSFPSVQSSPFRSINVAPSQTYSTAFPPLQHSVSAAGRPSAAPTQASQRPRRGQAAVPLPVPTTSPIPPFEVSIVQDEKRMKSGEIALRIFELQDRLESNYHRIAKAAFMDPRDPNFVPQILHLQQVVCDVFAQIGSLREQIRANEDATSSPLLISKCINMNETLRRIDATVRQLSFQYNVVMEGVDIELKLDQLHSCSLEQIVPDDGYDHLCLLQDRIMNMFTYGGDGVALTDKEIKYIRFLEAKKYFIQNSFNAISAQADRV